MIAAAALAALALLAVPALAQLPRLDPATLSVSASSTRGNSDAAFASDDDKLTAWRTTSGLPVELILDLGVSMAVDGLDYKSARWLTRRGGNAQNYVISVAAGDAPPASEAGWAEAAAGSFRDSSFAQKVAFDERAARYVRLRITSTYGASFTNAVEVGVFAGPLACGGPLQQACVDGSGALFCAAGAAAQPLAPRFDGVCVFCGCCGRLPCIAPEPACQEGFELATNLNNGQGGVFCKNCGDDCGADFGSIPAVFETGGGSCAEPPLRLTTPPSTPTIGITESTLAVSGDRYADFDDPTTLPLNFDPIPSGGSFCLQGGSQPIVVGGTVLFRDGSGDCAAAPAAADGSSCCSVKLWQPNAENFYFDYCTASVAVGANGVFWAFTEMPGDESAAFWGLDNQPHIHWQVDCAGCATPSAALGSESAYSGEATPFAASGYNKFYPLDTCTREVCFRGNVVAGPEHQAERFGDVVFKYDIIV